MKNGRYERGERPPIGAKVCCKPPVEVLADAIARGIAPERFLFVVLAHTKNSPADMDFFVETPSKEWTQLWNTGHSMVYQWPWGDDDRPPTACGDEVQLPGAESAD